MQKVEEEVSNFVEEAEEEVAAVVEQVEEEVSNFVEEAEEEVAAVVEQVEEEVAAVVDEVVQAAETAANAVGRTVVAVEEEVHKKGEEMRRALSKTINAIKQKAISVEKYVARASRNVKAVVVYVGAALADGKDYGSFDENAYTLAQLSDMLKHEGVACCPYIEDIEALWEETEDSICQAVGKVRTPISSYREWLFYSPSCRSLMI